MTVQFLVGLVALASLTWLCAWLGFHSEILQIGNPVLFNRTRRSIPPEGSVGSRLRAPPSRN